MIKVVVLKGDGLVEVLTACGVSLPLAMEYASPLLTTAGQYGVSSPLRLAHWLAQILHESGLLKYTEELASGAAYEGRKDLGNTRPGDGKRFKGRGLIQLTGRANYLRYARHCGCMELLNEPEKLAALPLAVDSAGWFWRYGTSLDLNSQADKDNVTVVTRLINGGLNGIHNRSRLLARLKEHLERVAVTKIQQALNNASGYPPVVVDGDMGPRTLSVIRELQSDHLLKVTGDVDDATWNIMQRWLP